MYFCWIIIKVETHLSIKDVTLSPELPHLDVPILNLVHSLTWFHHSVLSQLGRRIVRVDCKLEEAVPPPSPPDKRQPPVVSRGLLFTALAGEKPVGGEWAEGKLPEETAVRQLEPSALL